MKTAKERIKELEKEVLEKYPSSRNATNHMELIILDYLDEEKERVNNILHELVSAGYDQSYADAQTANYLHSMIDETLSPSTKDKE